MVGRTVESVPALETVKEAHQLMSAIAAIAAGRQPAASLPAAIRERPELDIVRRHLGH